MIKKITRLLPVLLIVGLAFPTNISAETLVTATDSEVGVTITAPDTDEPVTPLNPVDPTNPAPVDTDNPGTGNTGPLTVDVVPKFNFGSQEAYKGNVTLVATDTDPYVQVSDRSLTEAGWKLGVSSTKLFAVKPNATTATSFDKITPEHAIDYTLKLMPKATNPILMGGYAVGAPPVALAPVFNGTSVTVTSDGTKVFPMNAEAGKGMGTWLLLFATGAGGTSITFNSNDVQVDSTNTPLSYKAKLTWSMDLLP